ncbi:hypothetical protein C8J56DRAFT_890024 [Mycena floridula]|nr:hypothetical protein C8J56DRAFT_890024 [Mycena floridula]
MASSTLVYSSALDFAHHVNGKSKTYKVPHANAIAEMKAAGLTTGKSGDSHMYQGKDGFVWGVQNCYSGKNTLLEQLIFGDSKTAPKSSSATKWGRDKLTKDQPATPVQVVLSNWCSRSLRRDGTQSSQRERCWIRFLYKIKLCFIDCGW